MTVLLYTIGSLVAGFLIRHFWGSIKLPLPGKPVVAPPAGPVDTHPVVHDLMAFLTDTAPHLLADVIALPRIQAMITPAEKPWFDLLLKAMNPKPAADPQPVATK